MPVPKGTLSVCVKEVAGGVSYALYIRNGVDEDYLVRAVPVRVRNHPKEAVMLELAEEAAKLAHLLKAHYVGIVSEAAV